MASYSPLIASARPGESRDRNALIGFDTFRCFGSPTYYAMRMFSLNRGDTLLESKADGVPTSGGVPTLFFVASRDSGAGEIIVKIVNTSGEPRTVQLSLSGASALTPEGRATVLSSPSPSDTNSLETPKKVFPVEERLQGLTPHFARTVPPYSITVLRFGVF